MKNIPEVGDTVIIDAFAFTAPCGGTGLSAMHERPFAGRASAKIVKAWHDYETGWRYIGESVSDDLRRYINENAKATDHRVFFGQFDFPEAS